MTVLSVFVTNAQQNWTVPKQAELMTNTVEVNAESLAKGQKIYKSLCASCHGNTGRGDVVAMQSLNPKPTDFTTDNFQNQTDGTIYWKMSEGRGLMASYKTMLSEEQRWQVVNYLRTFQKSSASKNNDSSAPKTVVNTNQNTDSQRNTQAASKIDAFPFTNLINAKTTHIMQAKGFGLTIQHRFGLTKFDEGFVTNLMGLDLSANMRFAFEIPVSKKIMVEIGRTRYGKFYDVGTKYLAMQQADDNSTPFSLAIYENIAITTEKAPEFSSDATFENGTPFEYKFYHRFYYDTQLIISRKFSNNFSAQIAGQFIWRNLTPFSVKPKEKSYVIAIPISLRYKLGLTSAIDFEIMPNTHHKTMPISLGYEVASSGNHVFQITITNSDRFLSQNIFTLPTAKYNKDGFILGFNLTRYF
jgi:mono/diheme cytochrome c family protein